nr:hypothetical protein [Pseudomonas sp. CG7]
MRLFVPCYEGNIHIKWLRRLHITDAPAYTREKTAKYTDLMANGKARKFSFVMECKSLVTYPSAPETHTYMNSRVACHGLKLEGGVGPAFGGRRRVADH